MPQFVIKLWTFQDVNTPRVQILVLRLLYHFRRLKRFLFTYTTLCDSLRQNVFCLFQKNCVLPYNFRPRKHFDRHISVFHSWADYIIVLNCFLHLLLASSRAFLWRLCLKSIFLSWWDRDWMFAKTSVHGNLISPAAFYWSFCRPPLKLERNSFPSIWRPLEAFQCCIQNIFCLL